MINPINDSPLKALPCEKNKCHLTNLIQISCGAFEWIIWWIMREISKWWMKNRDGGVLEPQIILKLSVDVERTEVQLLVYSLRSLVWGKETICRDETWALKNRKSQQKQLMPFNFTWPFWLLLKKSTKGMIRLHCLTYN